METEGGAPPPASAVALVFQALEMRELCRCMAVCTEWQKLASAPALWRVLDLHDVDVTESLMAFVENHPLVGGAEEVSFQFSNGLQDHHMVTVGNRLPRLLRANLNACQQVGDAGVKALATRCKGLEGISLYWNLKVTDGSLLSLATYCPAIRSLNLSGCKSMTGDGLKVVTECLEGLTDLDLTRHVLLRDDGVAAAIRNCPRLVSLTLYANQALTDACISTVHLLPLLERLDLCGLNDLTDASMLACAQCPRLKYLNLTWCVNLTDAGMVPVAQGCPQLNWLSLHGNVKVTDATVDALAAGCPGLDTLDVTGCTGVEGRQHADLLAKIPTLVCFHVHA